ncbi:D-alanyl-D-alanine carboxypeptidase family protein [Hahella aquimaris]|uniref:D-alanyl-D-alanine carboxypeptidase family protein n=1 Tax=Hahella sp. HNIBRBA332 TaxID=3015983 RepID=UPI00273B62E9|nr:D-alanyl-D-alanine carboxypeptidase family protein [Hahella sp. HNIBRBA332]WLQ14145.1 D-alanyl-D-alanine carboxypeptidase family protein [Hahella sp. HNIBRBA332]
MSLPRMRVYIAFFLCWAVSAAWADQASLIPSAPQIAASSYILMDAESGAIIVEKNSEERLPPASLTKMMTSYVLDYEVDQGNVSFNDEAPISVKAWKTGGSKMFVREGTSVRLGDLIKGIIIQSGNDASVAVAEFLAGSEDAFASMMNQHAQRLGMNNTNFENATGLPSENHYSSAHDLAKLAKAIINDFPNQYPIYSEKYFTYNNIRQPNRNLLLWRDKSVDGLKTGHTEEAGYCLVSSAVRDGMRLISVVMGTKSEEARARETLKLLNYGFRYFETHKLYSAGQKLVDSDIWAGSADTVPLGLSKEIVVTIPRGKKDALEATVDIDKVIKAPIEVGAELGKLTLKLNGELLLEKPVVALEAVEEAGFFKRIWHAIVLFFMGLFE